MSTLLAQSSPPGKQEQERRESETKRRERLTEGRDEPEALSGRAVEPSSSEPYNLKLEHPEPRSEPEILRCS